MLEFISDNAHSPQCSTAMKVCCCFKWLASILMVLAASTLPAQAQMKCAGQLLATDYNGAVISGSKETLIAAVNNGETIRVGWGIDFDGDGETDLIHWSPANFLSVWKGEVFTQVGNIHVQHPSRGSAMINFSTTYREWRGSIGSNGKLIGRVSDREGEASEPRSVETVWCSQERAKQGWSLLYTNDTNGEAVSGSKQSLHAAIRSGMPIALGWGVEYERNGETHSIEHLITPVFVTIIDNDDVVAQLPEHIAQRGYAKTEDAFFDDPKVMWRGLMTTDGSFDAVWVDRATGETVRRSPQRAQISWFAHYMPDVSAPSLAQRSGVTRDETR